MPLPVSTAKAKPGVDEETMESLAYGVMVPRENDSREKRFFVMVKSLFTEDEARETKPPESVERPETANVLEPLMAFPTARYPEKSEVAVVEVDSMNDVSSPFQNEPNLALR